jgi:hypothetical protein
MHTADSITITIVMFALEAIAADQTVRIIEVVRVTIRKRAERVIPRLAGPILIPPIFDPDIRDLPEWPISEANCSCCVVVDG